MQDTKDKLPIMRVTRVDTHAFTVVIPGWNARALAMAHKIAARVVETLGSTENAIYVERGRHGLCTIVRVGVPGNGVVPPEYVKKVLGVLEEAARIEASVRYTTHRVGLATHRVEVAP